MVIKNLDDLRRLREETKQELEGRHGGETQIIVGMGTCGIAAGAREVMTAILSELAKRNLRVTVLQTGCIGMCQREPLVDVVRPGEKRITYGNVKPGDVPRIISEHVVNGRIVEELVVGKIG
ncbi:MAG: (2Fe-2S) ferredoxin domain-containing protein [Firmicutes bacterium]|jgi:NADP-reducing hydrogenase subunit HndB|nr:(2Fe-2S) ferredoxin domain-containing protein [Bacillota bacterium]